MNVYVVQSLHGGPSECANDKLCRLLFFIGALKNARAARVTAVVPYLCYARMDRRTKPNDPVITRYVASLLTAVSSRRTSRPDRRAAQIFPSRVFGGGFWRKSLRRTLPIFDFGKTSRNSTNLGTL
jgi:phosphoribosylpyrophosphate synthetase